MIRGLFICFEGIDGCGKTTQVQAVERYLSGRGIAFVSTREPGGTAIGDAIRVVVKDPRFSEMGSRCELLLYLASRAQHVAQVIEPALREGITVLCDRYEAATLAYQGYGRGLNLDLLHNLNATATGGLSPDLTLILDLDPSVAFARMRSSGKEFDRLELEQRDFFCKVCSGYRALAAQNPHRFALICADAEINRVTQQVISALDIKLQAKEL